MQGLFYIVGFFMLFLFGGCQQGPYQKITVDTDWGKEIIPGDCSAWTDGCNTYCRLNIHVSYKKISFENICKAERSYCIDDNPEKLKPCKNICEYVRTTKPANAQTPEQCQ